MIIPIDEIINRISPSAGGRVAPLPPEVREECIDMNSLQLLTLALESEEIVGHPFADEDIAQFMGITTVGNLCDILERILSKTDSVESEDLPPRRVK